MFVKLHGVISNEKIVINVNFIEVMQEISKESKNYANYYQAGARTLIRVNGKTLPVRETIIQIENKIKKVSDLQASTLSSELLEVQHEGQGA